MGWNGPMTHRQFLAWRVWEGEDMSQPGKLEYYLMGVSCEVRRVLSKNPNNVKLNDFQLKFVEKKQQSTAASKNQAALAKAVWVKRMNARVVYADPAPDSTVEPQQQEYRES